MKKIFTFLVILFVLIGITYVNSEPRRVLLEYATGTWCGWCPCGHQVIQNDIMPVYPNTQVISYHGSGSDPWINFEGNAIRSLLGFNAYPTGIVDRTNTPSNPYYTYDMWLAGVTSRYTTLPTAGVNVVMTQKTYNSSTRQLNVSISATAAQQLSGQFKISYVLIENNLVYPQNHYASCGTPGYDPNYVHKHVARSMMNGPTGENLNTGGVWNQGQTITSTLTKTLDAAFNADNCKVVVFVYKDNPVIALGGVEQSYSEAVTTPLGLEENNAIPTGYKLEQNYPNPFNPVTNIRFEIPSKTQGSMKLFDATGKVVYTFFEGPINAGVYNASLDASSLSSGIYFYTLTTTDFVQTRKMMLVK